MSDFEYMGVENRQMRFVEKSTGMTFWIQLEPTGSVDLVGDDRVSFDWHGELQMWSIREQRQV